MTSETEIPPVPVLVAAHTWNLDDTLAQVIAQGVRLLRERQVAFPPTLTPDEWDAVLDEMAEGFEAWHQTRHVRRNDEALPKLNRSLDLLREWFPHLWD